MEEVSANSTFRNFVWTGRQETEYVLKEEAVKGGFWWQTDRQTEVPMYK